MKKKAFLAIAVIFILMSVTAGMATAEDKKPDKKAGRCCDMMGKDKMDKDMMGCKMGDMPMHGMMGKQMTATSDGGVVVSIGNKLYKYDSNLNLQKQAEIPMDMEQMKKMMTNEPAAEPMEAMPQGGSEKKMKD